jgi:CheY-like chemotaxis protein
MNDATMGATAPDAACRVLVVDDNVDSAQSMSLLLGLEGYQVECAYDGEQALFGAGRFLPEVVLLDLGLPRYSGYEVARRLRAEPTGDDVLLVAVSGYGRERDRQAAREAGFDLHLTKPADPDEVLRVLSERRELREASRLAASALTTTAPPGAGAAPQPSDPRAPSSEPQRAGGSAEPAPSPAGARASPHDVPAAGAVRNA